MQTLPSFILAHLQPFRFIFFTNKTYLKAALLLTGILMCRGARTVCSILKVLGLKGETAFAKYHHVLNRAKWDILQASKILLEQIDHDQSEPLKLVIDGHLERRRGDMISAKGAYRDAVQSSKNYIVVSSGLKWLCVMAVKKFSWCKRPLALPFLTVLTPNEEYNKKNKKRHKTLQDWTCQIIMQIRRWFPNRKIIFIADNEFATAGIALRCLMYNISFVSRLKLNARLFDFPFKNHRGRPRNKGMRLPTIEAILSDPTIIWVTEEVSWYGGCKKDVQYFTGTCLWHVMSESSSPIPIRFVLVKSINNKSKPVLLMSTDLELSPKEIIETYVERWNIEVTFHEAREHLGIETQRQWSDKAIARTTPILFGLYSLVILIGKQLIQLGKIEVEQTAWYTKEEIKFSDILRGVRKLLLEEMYFCKDVFLEQPLEKSDRNFIDRVIDLFLHAA
jgi:hypothetical protein